MQKLMRVSHRFRIIFQAIFIFYFVINALLWLFANHATSQVFLGLNQVTLTPMIQFTAFLVSLIPLSVILYGLYQLISLFKNYEKGQVFSLQNVKYYKNLGYSVLTYVFVNFFSNILMSFVLTYQNPSNQQQIMASFGSSDIAFLITGGLIILISWVMKEGFELAEESAHTI